MPLIKRSLNINTDNNNENVMFGDTQYDNSFFNCQLKSGGHLNKSIDLKEKEANLGF